VEKLKQENKMMRLEMQKHLGSSIDDDLSDDEIRASLSKGNRNQFDDQSIASLRINPLERQDS
jgi:hypothetical protein